MKKTKKSLLLLLLVIGVAATAALGTMAWLTATDQKANTFTVGHVNEPTTDPITGDPLPDEELGGYIVEPTFDKTNNKLVPGGVYSKDPFVGVGAGSEESYVYVYVDNDFYVNNNNDVYFEISDAWEPVASQTKAGSRAGTYAAGLFKYKATLTPTAEADSWTSEPLFTAIMVDNATTLEELTNGTTNGEGNVTIYAYIHQAKDGEGSSLADTALADAVAWSTTLGN